MEVFLESGIIIGTHRSPEGPPVEGATNPADDCYARLHEAGWSVGDVAVSTPTGFEWLVTGTLVHGECPLRATGRTRAEAWQRACDLARAMGLLGTR
jgi:hypothetical protein